MGLDVKTGWRFPIFEQARGPLGSFFRPADLRSVMDHEQHSWLSGRGFPAYFACAVKLSAARCLGGRLRQDDVDPRGYTLAVVRISTINAGKARRCIWTIVEAGGTMPE